MSWFALACLCLPASRQGLCAAEVWGGSLAATSDYVVRGISRSDNGPAFQGDWHVATDQGIIGGVFGSSERVNPTAARSVELSAFLGVAWQAGDVWRLKTVASYYLYPWSRAASKYRYSEFDVEALYDDWLDVNLMYSPDTPRYSGYFGLKSARADSIDINVHTPWRRRLAASAGIGYASFAGSDGGGFGYWSLGAALDLAPVTLSLSYAGAASGAVDLFYTAAVRRRVVATAIWRF